MICRACSFDLREDNPFLERLGHKYFQCPRCSTVQTHFIKPECIITENDNSEGRNNLRDSAERLRRITEHVGQVRRAVDYGCGEGVFLRFLKMSGIDAIGIEKDTSSLLQFVPLSTLCAVFMVEVIEHLQNPSELIDEISMKLRDGGALYIETGTVDAIQSSKHNGYIDPSVGHQTILSIDGISIMCRGAGLDFHIINETSFIANKNIKK
jgi:SAM-dependent methyltransferase